MTYTRVLGSKGYMKYCLDDMVGHGARGDRSSAASMLKSRYDEVHVESLGKASLMIDATCKVYVHL